MARHVSSSRSREVEAPPHVAKSNIEECASASDDEIAQENGKMEEDSGSEASDNTSSEDEEANADTAHDRLSHVSFAALSRAQDAIGGQGSRKRRQGDDEATSEEQKSKLAAMRERLQELRERKEGRIDHGKDRKANTKKEEGGVSKQKDVQRSNAFFSNGDENDSEGSNSEDSDSQGSSDGDTKSRHKRSSKHAPTAMPANRAVGRYREVVQVPKSKARDPRFDVTSGNLDRNVTQSRYSFLNDYQSDELTSLKKALKDPKTKLNADQREKLQRKVVSLESKISASKAREREEKVRREHRKQEREAVAQGKNPFYLKKSDVKKQALVDRFEGMKSRQKDKVILRRRKKLAAKERKDMPIDRRV